MYHGLVFYTTLKNQKIREFRKRYDPTCDLIKDHISVIFPVPDPITEEHISEHIEGVLASWEPFNVHINGYIKSWDHWLFLTLGQGNDEVMRLFEDMYAAILKPYLRSDRPFTPHITMGYFGKGSFDIFNPQDELNKKKFQKAVNEINQMNINFHRKVDRLTLVTLNDTLTELVDIRDFGL